MLARAKIKESNISAVITRADGTIENLGVIWSSNIIKNLFIKFKNQWAKFKKRV